MRIFGSLVLLFLLLSVSVLADLPSTYDAPDSSYATNTVVDILSHGGGVWLATGRGLNFTLDGGQHWLLYNASNGLVSQNVSAAFSVGNRLWVGTNHNQIIDQENVAISDGLSYTDDNGQTWTQINFGSDGLNIEPPVWGGNRTIYDITGVNDGLEGKDWLFFSAFAGGLLASQDGGTNWRRIYPSPSDSIQFVDYNVPSYRNRYFSSVIDTSHTDSLFLWVGTAGGLFQFVYTTPPNKMYTRNIFDIGFCEQCSDSAGRYLYLGGDNGVTRGRKTGRPFITRFESDGLPGPKVSAVIGFAGRIFAGTVDTVSGNSTGLAVSDDLGQTYTPITLPEATGAGRDIVGFTLMNDRIYFAAQEAGLFVSSDTGATWDAILVDSVNTDRAYNVINSLYAYKDSLLLGTDSGLVIFEMDAVGDIQQVTHKVFPENPFTSARIIKVKLQPFESDATPGVNDSTTIWTVNRPMSLQGTPMVGRSTIDNDTLAFESFKIDTFSYDIGFIGDTAYVVWEHGIKYTMTGSNPSNVVTVYDSLNSSLNFTDDTLYVMKTLADTLFVGSTNGWAVSPDAGATWAVFRGNLDTLGADLVVNYTYSNTVNIDSAYITLGLTGDFIPAIGVQYRDDGPARIWVSGRPVSLGINGMTVGIWVPVTDSLGDSVGVQIKWRALYGGDFAWNYAFYGDSVFAATNSGVLVNYGDTSEVWDTVAFVDPVQGYDLLAPNAAVFAADVIGEDLWVGTSDGTVRKSLTTPNDVELFVRVDSTSPEDEVYAFPVPFSAVRGELCQFHFSVKQAAYVTVEVYDFAMNLVSRPIDNVYFEPGSYPNGTSERFRWDGRNGKGDNVAVGVYYFKVTYSTGEVQWGKLAVIP